MTEAQCQACLSISFQADWMSNIKWRSWV